MGDMGTGDMGTPLTAGNLKCLVVDDHAMMRKVAIEIMVSLGFKAENIDQAEDGAIADQKLTANLKGGTPQFQIVFLDWTMPGISGYNLLQQCRQRKEFDNIAFAMMTAETEKSEVIKALQAGATSYIQKPYTRVDFQKKLVTILKWLTSRNSGY